MNSHKQEFTRITLGVSSTYRTGQGGVDLQLDFYFKNLKLTKPSPNK